MHIPLNGKSRSIAGASDLTVMAPIRRGLVPSLESITYKTRLRRLMEVLQLLRQASHEYVPFRPISDAAERVGRIHSFRVAIIEPEDKLLLAVTFDGARESYVRVLWQKIGTLLDLLFCNTEGHVPAYGRSMADWDAWIEGIQVKTDFFYSRPRLTSDDVQFLRDEEACRRSAAADADLQSVQRSEPTAEIRAWTLANQSSTPAQLAETARQSIQTVALLHRLTAWFIPGTPDGDFLHRAARDLLPEFVQLVETKSLMNRALAIARERFAEALDWFLRPYEPRTMPPPVAAAPSNALKGAVQGGILESYNQMTHGALLLMAFKPGTDVSPFWAAMQTRCVSALLQPTDGRTVWNVALTHEGLRAAGLTESELADFPLEFRQGMEERAGLLGDFWINHPDRWRRPTNELTGQPIEMGAVHVVVQVRCGQKAGMPADLRYYSLGNPKHPLGGDIATLTASVSGCMDILAALPMVRHTQDPANVASPALEHFGYADGNGQPELDPAKKGPLYENNLVHPGEFIIGRTNAADPPAGQGMPDVSPWLRDGSFLVLRKLSQDVKMFRDILKNGAQQMTNAAGVSTQQDKEELVAGKLMGRKRNGEPLIAPKAGNEFTYDTDPQGSVCPLHAHIRLSNPRNAAGADRPIPSQGLEPPLLPAGARPPRIMRRSMSFGLPFDVDPTAQRGVYFMAYNARIAEQFEVIQGWLAGGNSTGGFSGRKDPLMGIPAAGERRSFMFEHPDSQGNPRVHRITLDGNDDATEVPDPLVRLEWGTYLFTPSMAALKAFELRAAKARAEWPWSVKRGRCLIARLMAMDGSDGDRVQAWKAALEDPESLKDYSAASIWAAIREDHGGVLRTPYGVLAASHGHARAVLQDPQRNYSVVGYRERSAPTLGDMYLGMDDLGPGCPYHARSKVPNEKIRAITEDEAFTEARRLTTIALDKLIKREQDNAASAGDPVWRLRFGAEEVWDDVLEGLCRLWFGLPSAPDAPMVPGSFSWDWKPGKPVPYPGHFLSPSRYIFQPQPGGEVARIGSLHGTAVNTAFRQWVTALRDNNEVPKDPNNNPARLGAAFFDAFPRPVGGTAQQNEAQDELVAVIVLGAMIGFLPTVQGNLRQSLNEWLQDGTFWSLRAGLTAPSSITSVADPKLGPVRTALQRSMMLRPSPEVVWRRAVRDHMLGQLQVHTGETVVVSIVSATHEKLEQGQVDTEMVFGGPNAGSAVPTHACPGRLAAMGTLMGIVTALLECKEALRPTPFPLSFRIEAPPTPAKAPQPRQAKLRLAALSALKTKEKKMKKDLDFSSLVGSAAPQSTAARPLRLLSGGDSWFGYPFGTDLAAELAARPGVKVINQGANGTRLDVFAGKPAVPGHSDTSGIGRLCKMFVQLAASGVAPDAILISAGGNDVVDDVLRTYINDISALNLTPAEIKALIASDKEINDTALKNLMDGPNGVMRKQVRLILDKLKAQCKRTDDSFVPVVWQAYDYPVPDGRIPIVPIKKNPFSVLWRPLSDLGYTDIGDTFLIMKKVVDRYNKMLADLSTSAEYKDQLIHADLRNTLIATVAGNAYEAHWDNELHPTNSGFQKLADKLFTNHLAALMPAQPAPPSNTNA